MSPETNYAALKFDMPAEIAGDLDFDRILAAIEQLFQGADPRRAAAFDDAVRAVGLPPLVAWSAMAMASCHGIAMLYVQRHRGEVADA